MGGTYKTEGVVLQKRPLGEADLIVTLLSPECGRMDAVARGARRSTRARAGLCEPFQHLDLLLARGRSLDVVSQMGVRQAFRGIVRDLERIATGTYLLELYMRLLEPGPHVSGAGVFGSLLRALGELDESGGVRPELVCRRAELRLLTVMGLAPHLDSCVRCGDSRELTHFNVEQGAVVCAVCQERDGQARPVPVGMLALLRSLRTPRLDSLGTVSELVSPADLRACEQFMQAHLEWHGSARVRSRSFLEQVRRR